MVTADRVLPWRRGSSQSATADELKELLEVFRARHPKVDTGLVTRAYAIAYDAHDGQLRRSGDPYIQHPVAVATILAELGLDDITLAAALLHDAVEDTAVSVDDILRDFGPEVAAIVDGVTKLDRVSFDSKEAQQAATMRKMLVAMAKDIRVLLIKLADRLHNMRTIAAMPDRQAAPHRPGDPRRLRPPGPPPRHRRHQAAARGPGLRHPVPQAVRRDRADGRRCGRPSATSTCPRSSTWSAPAWPSCASTPRWSAGRSTTGASTRRWSSRGGSSTTSTTSSGSGCWWAA